MIVKLGGSMRYTDLGPSTPGGVHRYMVGGRSVHAADASSGISKSASTGMRSHTRKPGFVRGAPLTIKRRLAVTPDDKE